MASPTLWQRTKKSSKSGFDKLWGYADKLGAPVNRFSNKLGSESFWPTSIDKESEKAARILRSFCKDGFYQEELTQSTDGPKQKQKVLKKIPTEVIKKAKGLAIFTTMRTGLWISGAGGSGIVVARLEDGSWSCPSGILLHTAALGFLVGVDIYDCVLVLNTDKAVQAFSQWRCTLGTEVSAAAGPVGMGGILDTELHKRQSPIFTYMKSRGFYAGVQIDGTVIIERGDENEKFYHDRIPASDILAGKVRHPPFELKVLMETLKAAQGDVDVDTKYLTDEPPPADYEVFEEGHVFGIPDKDDPDPYGIYALEKEGLVIKQASSKREAPADEFDFNPRISSPVYEAFNRRSIDSSAGMRSGRSSWRMSSTTATGAERRYTTTDVSTQTDFDSDALSVNSSIRARNLSEHGSPTRERNSPHLPGSTGLTPIKSVGAAEMVEEELDHKGSQASSKEVDLTNASAKLPEPLKSEDSKNAAAGNVAHDDNDDDDEEEEEEAQVHEVKVQEFKQVHAPQKITKAKLVTVPKRVPPQLPPRNPGRGRTLNTASSTGTSTDAATAADATTPVSLSPSKESSFLSGSGPPSERPESNTSREISPVKPPALPARQSTLTGSVKSVDTEEQHHEHVVEHKASESELKTDADSLKKIDVVPHIQISANVTHDTTAEVSHSTQTEPESAVEKDYRQRERQVEAATETDSAGAGSTDVGEEKVDERNKLTSTMASLRSSLVHDSSDDEDDYDDDAHSFRSMEPERLVATPHIEEIAAKELKA